jgi:hypothetical protein
VLLSLGTMLMQVWLMKKNWKKCLMLVYLKLVQELAIFLRHYSSDTGIEIDLNYVDRILEN